ncbi:hypothetical protein GCM10029964_059790 [Kibdelosporangium lantanae]
MISGCGGGSGQPPASGGTTGAARPTEEAPALQAATADPPTRFDAGSGVTLPVEGASTDMMGKLAHPLITLRDRTAYYVNRQGVGAVDVLTGKPSWTTPVDGQPGAPNGQNTNKVDTYAPSHPWSLTRSSPRPFPSPSPNRAPPRPTPRWASSPSAPTVAGRCGRSTSRSPTRPPAAC